VSQPPSPKENNRLSDFFLSERVAVIQVSRERLETGGCVFRDQSGTKSYVFGE